MRVLGISGTPRVNGNSEILLRAALEPFAEAGWDCELFLLSERAVHPCTGCDLCARSGICAIRDDMDILYRAFDACDAVLFSAPAYYRNVPAQLKAVMDRTYAVGRRRPLEGKIGGAIAVGRGTGGGQPIVLNILYNFFLSSGMLCAPGELNGVTAVADAPGDILKQPNRLRQARVLGENVRKYTQRLRE